MESHNQKKKLFLVLVFSAFSILTMAQGNHSTFFKDADNFLKQHVKNGKVDYSTIKKDQSELRKLISYLNQNGVKTVKNNEEKALLINAYNLFVIKGVVDNYPTQSPLDQPDFFKKDKYFLRGGTLSLEDLENNILRPITNDERLHFVLVCGALGCPKIAPYAYVPERLEAQLDERTEAALNDDEFLRVDKTNRKVGLSQIFSWYKGDFVKDDQTINSFINKFRSDDIPSSYKTSIYTYDWTLNDTKPVGGASSDDGGSNLTRFTPSKLFGLGQFEVQTFNTIYSQTGTRDRNGTESISGERLSIFTSRLSTTWGVTKTGWLNAGVDLFFSGGSRGPVNDSGILQHFGSSVNSREYALTATRFTLKFAPSKKWSWYSIQLGLQLPVASNPEARGDDNVFVALNRYVLSAQFFYDIKLSDKFRLFYELNGQILPKRNDDVFIPTTLIDIPSTLIVNYFPTNKISLFVLGQYAPRYGTTNTFDGREDKFGLLQRITQLGAGAKYQLTDQIGFELSYGNFVGGRGFTDANASGLNAGNGALLNFGVRFINR